MSKVFILAKDYAEASWIARLAGLKGSIGWELMGDFATLGCRGNVVLATGEHCWRSQRGGYFVGEVAEVVATRDLKVIHVPCPSEWTATGFQLPEGWDQPKEYPARVVLHPPEPKLTFWQRVRIALARNWFR